MTPESVRDSLCCTELILGTAMAEDLFVSNLQALHVSLDDQNHRLLIQFLKRAAIFIAFLAILETKYSLLFHNGSYGGPLVFHYNHFRVLFL